jgi:glycine/D-amino acid oxidase-like deaminating enzyme
MHLLSMGTKNGVNLQTNTPVLKVSDSVDSNGYWTVNTPRGEIRAKKVVYATNGYTSGLLPEYKQIIHPVRGICSRITVKNKPPGHGKLKSMVLYYGPKVADYQANRPDGSFVIGGAWSTCKFKHPQQWRDVFDDSALTPAATGYFHGFMERTFSGWGEAKSRVDHLWTGIMGVSSREILVFVCGLLTNIRKYTEDNEPHIGKVPSKEGLYICAGFNGHGMPLVLLCAKGIARMLSEDCEFSKTGIPAIYETSKSRM